VIDAEFLYAVAQVGVTCASVSMLVAAVTCLVWQGVVLLEEGRSG
jgi:hypothetical protein